MHRNAISIPECPWRAGTSCRHPVIDPMHESEGGIVLGGGAVRPAKLPIVQATFARNPETGPGAESPDCLMLEGYRCRYTPATPRYDAPSRKLFVGHFMIRHYLRNRWNQGTVLEMFESLGWPLVIEDPLCRKLFDPKHAARQRKTVSRLNHEQTTWLVWFHGHEIDRTIGWEFRIPLKGT